MAESVVAIAFVMHGAREAMTNGMPHIEEQIRSIEEAVFKKPSFTFDLAKTIIESACKTILTDRKISFNADDDLPKLFKLVTANLPFLPSLASGEADARKSLKKTLGGLHTAVHGICELRNTFGFASHGAVADRPAMEMVQALMVAQSADAIVGFLHRVHRQERLPTPGKPPEYEDHVDFNNYVDEAHELVRIFDEEFTPSRILFEMAPEPYRVYLAEYQLQANAEEPETNTDNPVDS